MSLELLLAGIMLIALTFYVLLGGADYGAGVWTLFAKGPRAEAQRTMISRAIGPIWEANHVWLILVVTILFTAFPKAYAVISVRLHVPLAVMLIGIVLRGSAFAFRTHDVVDNASHEDRVAKFWDRVFALSSVLTPIMLGITIGAIASGHGGGPMSTFVEAFIRPWATPFCVLTGCLALTLFAFLAAMYLILEATDQALREDFRRRALWAAAVSAMIAILVFALAKHAAPQIRYNLTHTAWGVTIMGLAGISALGTMMALRRGWYRAAFYCALCEVTAVLWGWALGQYPYLVPPDVTLADAAPAPTLQLVFIALIVGGLLLFPSLFYLYRIFKGRTIRRVLE
jgi:cytochrome d ubiquinol oxidase subunit II